MLFNNRCQLLKCFYRFTIFRKVHMLLAISFLNTAAHSVSMVTLWLPLCWPSTLNKHTTSNYTNKHCWWSVTMSTEKVLSINSSNWNCLNTTYGCWSTKQSAHRLQSVMNAVAWWQHHCSVNFIDCAVLTSTACMVQCCGTHRFIMATMFCCQSQC